MPHHNALTTGGLYAVAVALLVLALAISQRPAPGHVDHAYWCAAFQYGPDRGCPLTP